MINNGYILTAAEMLAAEEKLIGQGTSVETLMERAGQGAAQEIWRLFRDMPTLVLCGPGNNGGDGYVIAEWLRLKGVRVSIASTGNPTTDAANNAFSLWKGTTESIDNAKPQPLVVDCLFGTGLKRPVSGTLLEQYLHLCGNAQKLVAIDIPSGIDSDTGQLLNQVPEYDLTIGLGAYKPAHFLEPGRSRSRNILGVDIGIETKSTVRIQTRPALSIPKATDHKYSRGLVAVVAGDMPGAAELTALAAQSSGAGYAKIFAPDASNSSNASIVVNTYSNLQGLSELLGDPRIGAVALGPGLGRSEKAVSIIDTVLESGASLVLDADALTVMGESFSERLKSKKQAIVCTPHSGEFAAIGGLLDTNKIKEAMKLAKSSGATILHKGIDTVIAETTGDTVVSKTTCSWLSTAGTGDVLTGVIAARLACGTNPFEAAQQGQWLHSRAAQLSGPSFSPESLIASLPHALAECL